MSKSERLRWLILIAMLIGTLVAIFNGPDDSSVIEVSQRTNVKPRSSESHIKIATSLGVFEDEAIANPFERRSWEEPVNPKVVGIESTAIAPVVLAAAEPEGPPPLPYKYVGRFGDDTGSVVYLARGEAALVAHPGDVLDGNYKVLVVSARSIEFEHISTGTKQVLQLPEAE